VALPSVERFTAIPGRGIDATVEGRRVLVGNAALLTEAGIDVAALTGEAGQAAAAGQTPMFAAVDAEAAGLIVVADPVKPDSAGAVAQLKALGLEVWMLTGDNAATAQAVAADVAIDHVLAEVLPHQKAEQVRALQESTKQAARAKTKLRRLATQADTASYMAEVEVGLETARAATPAASPPLLDLAQDILEASALPYAQGEYGAAVELATQAEQLIQIIVREPAHGSNNRKAAEVALEAPLPLRLKAGGSLRREPRDRAPAVASLAEGALVTALAWRESWFRVETEDGTSGWIAETLAAWR